jgi:hypothetical protein
MKKFSRWRLTWHWLFDYKSFRVIYPDAHITRRLCYSEALELAKSFNGQITFDPM